MKSEKLISQFENSIKYFFTAACKEEMTLGDTKAELMGLCFTNDSAIRKIMEHGSNGFIIISPYRTDINNEREELDLSEEYAAWSVEHGDNPTEFLEERSTKVQESLTTYLAGSQYTYSTVYSVDGKNNEPRFSANLIVYAKDNNGNDVSWNSLFRDMLSLSNKHKLTNLFVQYPGLNANAERILASFPYHDAPPSSYVDKVKRMRKNEFFLNDKVPNKDMDCDIMKGMVAEKVRADLAGRVKEILDELTF